MGCEVVELLVVLAVPKNVLAYPNQFGIDWVVAELSSTKELRLPGIGHVKRRISPEVSGDDVSEAVGIRVVWRTRCRGLGKEAFNTGEVTVTKNEVILMNKNICVN